MRSRWKASGPLSWAAAWWWAVRGDAAFKSHATVTVCHTRTKDLKAVCREADILVAAAGISRNDHGGVCGARSSGDRRRHHVDENGKLCGDVTWEELQRVASAATPVPAASAP